MVKGPLPTSASAFLHGGVENLARTISGCMWWSENIVISSTLKLQRTTLTRVPAVLWLGSWQSGSFWAFLKMKNYQYYAISCDGISTSLFTRICLLCKNNDFGLVDWLYCSWYLEVKHLLGAPPVQAYLITFLLGLFGCTHTNFYLQSVPKPKLLVLWTFSVTSSGKAGHSRS